MTGAPVYRDATTADALRIARVWVSAWRAAYAGMMPKAYLDSLDAAQASVAFERSLRENMAAMVVESDDQVVGFTAYGPSRDADAGAGVGEVIAINLHPGWWRQGIGTRLLQQTLDRLAARGNVRATLWVLRANARARQFYEAIGWQCDGAEKRDDRLTGFELHEVRYRVDL